MSEENDPKETLRDMDTGEFRFSNKPNKAHEIEWREWGADAFVLAEEQGKLVLLSISAVWCHWCHVMDETTYSDPAIIEKINSNFIPVRVDSDRRPDVNRRYNQGGWPSTVFLVPSGAAVTGLTFAPAAQLITILDRLSAGYRKEKEAVDLEAAEQAEMERELFRTVEPGVEIDERASTEVEAWILASWDKGYGGIGSEPKFPPIGAIEFALSRYIETGNHAFKAFAVSTLDGMRNGELFDKVEGGFFRYATARDWSSPHYEKMLADNADLIWLYLSASEVLGRQDFAETARLAIEYVLLNLLDEEQRGFFGSQDADEHYYHRDRGGRALMEKPRVDRTIYTDTTSQMISALVLASAVLNDAGLLAIAERAADFLWREGYRHTIGACHFFDAPEGKPHLWGQPADQVWLLKAQLELFQATGEVRFLERATELATSLIEHHMSEQGWLVEAVVNDEELPAALTDAPVDFPDVVLNGAGARVLLALGELVPEHGYREAAERILSSLGEKYKQYTYFSAGYALAVELLLDGFIEIRISNEADREARKEIVRAATVSFSPRKLVRPETIEDFMPAEADGELPIPAAVVCSPASCLPVQTGAELGLAISILSGRDKVGGDSKEPRDGE
ncbi:MAG: thioredoxin domain-containing protein [Candidatus Geothermincolia bacterium]